MPGDYTLGLDWPTCGIDNQKCPNYLSRCDLCKDRERRIKNNGKKKEMEELES